MLRRRGEPTENFQDARRGYQTFDRPRPGDKPKTGDAHCRILFSIGRRNTSQRYRREAPLARKLRKVGRATEKKPLSGPGPISVRSVLRSLSPPTDNYWGDRELHPFLHWTAQYLSAVPAGGAIGAEITKGRAGHREETIKWPWSDLCSLSPPLSVSPNR